MSFVRMVSQEGDYCIKILAQNKCVGGHLSPLSRVLAYDQYILLESSIIINEKMGIHPTHPTFHNVSSVPEVRQQT